MDLTKMVPKSWRKPLAETLKAPFMAELGSFLEDEYASQTVYPPKDQIFTALDKTPFEDVKVLLLGQDPYHGAGQAHGLCFSVCKGVTPPPSLKNVFKEMKTDVGVEPPGHGCLEAWAERGVLLLNAVLTVREKSPASHQKKGWETFTDAVIQAVSAREDPVVFVLWGGFAKKKKKLVDTKRHAVVESGHPSPLSQKTFFGSKPFSKVNAQLEAWGKEPIDWSLEP